MGSKNYKRCGATDRKKHGRKNALDSKSERKESSVKDDKGVKKSIKPVKQSRVPRPIQIIDPATGNVISEQVPKKTYTTRSITEIMARKKIPIKLNERVQIKLHVFIKIM